MNKFFLILMIILFNSIKCERIEIKPIEEDQLTAAKDIIVKAVLELQIIPCKDLKELNDIIEKENSLDDLKNIQQVYSENKGLFLAVLVDDNIVGMGAIKYFNDDICELKRMFFDPIYRNKGLGSKLLEVLIQNAKQFGYKKMRLEVYNPIKQTNAIALYNKFEFYEIKPYHQTPAKLVMEKILK